MPIRTIAIAALLGVGLCLQASAQHVVMIVVDDVGPELLGVYDGYYATVTGQPSGYPAATPAIDSMLAAQGVTFTHAWGNNVCSPTRATILTGRYSYRTGVGGRTTSRPTPTRRGLGAEQVLLPKALRNAPAPYSCIALGKWHLAERTQLDVDPLHPLGSPPGSWFDSWAGTYYSMQEPPGLSATVWAYSVWTKSFAAYPHVLANGCDPLAPPCTVQLVTPPIENYATVDTANDAIQCLREATGPLFLYVAFNGIHAPLHDVPQGLPSPTCPEYTPTALPCDTDPSLSENAARTRCMLESLDKQIGRVLCEVDFTTTTVILLGDNGTAKNAVVAPYPPSHAKASLYEGGVRVPLIVRSPLTPASARGTFQTAPVNTTDLFATVCDLAGAPTPSSAVDSVSLRPYLEGSSTAQRPWVYSEDFFPHFQPDPITGEAPASFGTKRHAQAICDGRFKLIRQTRLNAGNPVVVKEQFFDLAAGAPDAAPDYFEAHDLLLTSLSSEALDALQRLRATLDTDFPYLTR